MHRWLLRFWLGIGGDPARVKAGYIEHHGRTLLIEPEVHTL